MGGRNFEKGEKATHVLAVVVVAGDRRRRKNHATSSFKKIIFQPCVKSSWLGKTREERRILKTSSVTTNADR